MYKIFGKQSLKSIINAISVGLVDYENPDSLLISSEQMPDVFIKLVEIDIQDYVRNIIVGKAKDNSREHKPKFDKAETTFTTFVIFKKYEDKEDSKQVLGCMDLLELNIASELSGEANKLDSEWSLDNSIWNLFTSESPTTLKEIDDEQLSEY